MGQTRLCLLWLFAIAAAYTDLRFRRVPNRLIVYTVAAGLILAACGGWVTLWGGLIGLVLGFTLLLPAFILRMVGGGDVKSLAAIGLFTGPHILWVSFLLGTAAGGLAALALLCARFLQSRGPGPHQGATAWTLPYAAILAVSAALTALLT